jgi:hypothetical protein
LEELLTLSNSSKDEVAEKAKGVLADMNLLKNKIDIIHSHGYNANYILFIIRLLIKKKKDIHSKHRRRWKQNLLKSQKNILKYKNLLLRIKNIH